MHSYPRKLLTIITEAVIESLLVQDIERLGAHGYTASDARGKGSRGVRSADWSNSSNVRIEVICDTATADLIVAHVQSRYSKNYAMVLFVTDVAVLRPDKF